MSNGSGKNTKWCNACKVRFTIYARRVKRHTFCPICGETVDVVQYALRDKSHEIPRRSWTTKEEAELKRLITKGFRTPELMKRFNRTEMSIRKKAERLNLSFEG